MDVEDRRFGARPATVTGGPRIIQLRGWRAMAAVDPYSPCPCGSGQKFKWCCQKVEAFADRAERLFEGGQVEAAFQALDEGLRKVPDNPWLMLRKALIHFRRREPARARPLLE